MRRQQRMAHVVALRVIDVCVLAVPALAQDCPELVGHLPYHGHGEPLAVAASGHYAYVGTDAGLVVADVSDVSAPVEVGFVHTNEAVGVVVSGGYVYYLACCGGGG